MALRINSAAPNFTAETTQGKINLHEWIGDGWGILFSHPKDFTPVCTTELGYMARPKPEFEKRGLQDPRAQRGPGHRSPEVGQGHRGDRGCPGHLSADRRPGAEGGQGVRHASG